MAESHSYVHECFPDIMNAIFMIRENIYYLRHIHIFRTKIPRSLKCEPYDIPFCTSQLLLLMSNDNHKYCSLVLFKDQLRI